MSVEEFSRLTVTHITDLEQGLNTTTPNTNTNSPKTTTVIIYQLSVVRVLFSFFNVTHQYQHHELFWKSKSAVYTLNIMKPERNVKNQIDFFFFFFLLMKE